MLALIALLAACLALGAADEMPVKLPPIVGINTDHRQWATHRSNQYFGLRAQDQRSPLFGTMWYEIPATADQPLNLRHWCDQDDMMVQYGWNAADGISFGQQSLTDHGAKFEFDWINSNDAWSARITLQANDTKHYAVLFYLVAEDGDSNTMFSAGTKLEDGILRGYTSLFGDVSLSITATSNANITQSTLVSNDVTKLSQLDQLVLANSDNSTHLLVQKSPLTQGRFAAVQLNVANSVTIELALSTVVTQPLTGDDFTKELAKRVSAFNDRMSSAFPLADTLKKDPINQAMANYAVSNMLGSIGYWYGYNEIQLNATTIGYYGPQELFSAVPARSGFPHGFLWDEGFHNLLIRRYDPELSLKIVISWLNTMSTDGWIPREMMLDEEAAALVDPIYVPQHPDVANPPSFFFVYDQMISDEDFVTKHDDLFKQMYTKMRTWYDWLGRMQAGKINGTFRWRGRDILPTEVNPKTLASGFDDYPRASEPTDDEYHLDLRCWMYLASSVMSRLATKYGTPEEKQRIDSQNKLYGDFDDIVAKHWDEDKNGFYDYGYHSFNVTLNDKYLRVVNSPPTMTKVTDGFGCNSLFPLMMKLIPADSKYLTATLKRLNASDDVWTPYGLRALGKSSSYYGQYNSQFEGPYWRGNIWINVNYMVLSGLQYYSTVPGPNQVLAGELFVSLRDNVVGNMANEFARTGYIWEHYNDTTGHGEGNHPFTGWSAVVVLNMIDDSNTTNSTPAPASTTAPVQQTTTSGTDSTSYLLFLSVVLVIFMRRLE